jgi:hypothetical protein
MKGYRCRECGTGFSTTGDKAPPSPNWDDGHICDLVEVESKINSIKFRQPGKQIGSMLAHSHKTIETGEILVSKEDREGAFGYTNKRPVPLQTGSPIIDYDEDAGEARMRIIGQNGNTGEHYDNVDPDADLPPFKEVDYREEDLNG